MAGLQTLESNDWAAPTRPTRTAISVTGLTKSFGDVRALDDLSFEVGFGSITGFLGPNGAGKSTTLRALLGLVEPTAGTATVLGVPYRQLERPSATVGAVLETQSFNPLRSGRNHLRVLAAVSGWSDVRVDEVLELVDLTGAAKRKAGKYSLGMRQRLGLAGAMLGKPGILILDEPANGLDPQGIRWLREFLKDFAALGHAVLVSSHQLGEIEQMADEVVLIHRGRLIRQGSVRDLTAGDVVVVGSSDARRLADVLVGNGLAVERSGPSELTVRDVTTETVGRLALEAGVPLSWLGRTQARLEQVFLEMTKEEFR